MKTFRKIIILILFLSILIYPVKKHMDTVQDLSSSVAQMLRSPLATIGKIYKSEELLGFPADSLYLARTYQKKLPQEKEYFIHDSLYQDPLFSQRMIEFNFPLLYRKEARCGFIPNNISLGESFETIEMIGAYKIVCSS